MNTVPYFCPKLGNYLRIVNLYFLLLDSEEQEVRAGGESNLGKVRVSGKEEAFL